MEAEEAQEPQVVLGDAGRGVADEAHSSCLQVIPPAEIVMQHAVRRGAHGVDGEVAARGVFPPVVGEGDLGMAAVGALVAAERGDFVAVVAGKRGDGAVCDPARYCAGFDVCAPEQCHHPLGRVGSADVDIGALAPEQRIAHASAHEADVGAVGCECLHHRAGGRRRHPGCAYGSLHPTGAQSTTSPGTISPSTMLAGT